MRVCAIIAAAVALAASSPVEADFRMEMSGEEIREALGHRAVEDLAVGETAAIPSLNMCTQDGSLFLYTMVGLTANVPGQRSNYSVTREADRRVSVAVTSPEGGAHAVRQMIFGAVAGAQLRGCRLAGMADEQLFRVITINGLTSDREVFEGPER